MPPARAPRIRIILPSLKNHRISQKRINQIQLIISSPNRIIPQNQSVYRKPPFIIRPSRITRTQTRTAKTIWTKSQTNENKEESEIFQRDLQKKIPSVIHINLKQKYII